ncbi:MAG TPA: hypothetical protein VFY10_12020 [Dehalococcoidia bacterium]|nr:hypothetical protein [Dehalococcoidia bacterium]
MTSRADFAFELGAGFDDDLRVAAEPSPFATARFVAAPDRLLAAAGCFVVAVFLVALLGEGAPDRAGAALLDAGRAAWPAGILDALAFFAVDAFLAAGAFFAGRPSEDPAAGTWHLQIRGLADVI